jgi:hypothetical protein
VYITAAIQNSTLSFVQNSQEYTDTLFQAEESDSKFDKEINTIEQFHQVLNKLKGFVENVKDTEQPKSILKRDSMAQGRNNKSEQGF